MWRRLRLDYAMYVFFVSVAWGRFVDELRDREWGRALVAFDRLVWAFVGGHADVTISWGVGWQLLNGRPGGKILGPVVDGFMRLFDGPDHSRRTAFPKGAPPDGSGSHNLVITLFGIALVIGLGRTVLWWVM